MGAAASRSPPTARLVRIRQYSKFVRAPAPRSLNIGTIFFRDLCWNVTATAMRFNEGIADCLVVPVVLDHRHMPSPESDAGTAISIEILDSARERTVFHMEGTQAAQDVLPCLTLAVLRRELEASSCVDLDDDRLAIKCTLSSVDTKRSPKRPMESPEMVAVAGSHTLTIASFTKLKAALRNNECARSTHFAVGGSRWFFKLCPNGYSGSFLSLVRVGYDEAPTTAEFSFEFHGVANFESEKMTRTFGLVRSEHVFQHQLLESSTHDRLVVRCYLHVIMPEKPSLLPAAAHIITRPESIRTPLFKRHACIVER